MRRIHHHKDAIKMNYFFLYRLHDRKLSVLGLCSLLSMTNTRPQEVSAAAGDMLPSMLILFQGLKRAYASKLITYQVKKKMTIS